MYRLFPVALALLVLFTSGARAQSLSGPAPHPAAGATAAPAVPGVVVVVRQLGHARAALKTAEALRHRPRFEEAVVEVVVCGEGSRSLRATEEAASELLAEAGRLRVRLLACGMSLAQFGIDPEALAPGIEVVQNGLLHSLERQAEGFLSVEL